MQAAISTLAPCDRRKHNPSALYVGIAIQSCNYDEKHGTPSPDNSVQLRITWTRAMSCASDQASAESPFFAELLFPFAKGRGLMPFSDSARLARAGMGAGALLDADLGEGWPFACTYSGSVTA